jgi:hypothetical protein
MPSTSKSQQRLMGVAYAVKAGHMQLSDVSDEYRDKVAELINGMTLQQLKDFASTEHEGLPDKVKEAMMPTYGGPQNTMMPGAGIGNISLPNTGTGATGSGDIPAGMGWAKDKYKQEKAKRKKRKKQEEESEKPQKPILTYEQFIFEKLNNSK